MNYIEYKNQIINNHISPIMLLSYSEFMSDENTLDLFYQINSFLQKTRDDPYLYEIWNLLFDKNKSLLTQYKKHIFKNKECPLIFLSFTTCKRYDLFTQTMNSLLNHWLDIDRVDYWFCIDDNSSSEDRKQMEVNYPGIDYYWKTIDEKGHLKSMNIIWNKLNELKPKYWIHMEDDFLFFDKMNYVTCGLKGFSFHVKQVLFNLNYAETIEQYHIQGDIKLNDEYSLHDYKKGTYHYPNQHYWPYYSFRPSIVDVDAILKLGDFTSPVTFFERYYADKWALHYKSAFFNKITCLHIGKLTNQHDKPNAYELNQMNQFHETPLTHVKIINLERRPDRKNKMVELLKPININYEFVNAVDGNKLNPNDALKKIFDGNDFGYKKGVMGCALSHYFLWQKLIDDTKHEYYIIMEDDISLTPHFKTSCDQLKNEFVEKDMILLGYHMFNKNRLLHQSIYDNYDTPLTIKPFNHDLYIGGFFTYSINKKGAHKLLKYIGQHGIKHGIDFLIKIMPELNCYESQPLITTSIWNENGQSIDTDIQNKFDPLTFDTPVENYIFFPNLDIGDHDIHYNPNITLEEKFSLANQNPSCIGFNTLGFFKNKLVDLKPSRYFKKGDGIYIKESKLNESKINKSKNIRVKMLCNWCSSKQLCDEWSNMCEKEYTWKNIEITWEDTNIDYYVIINSPHPNNYYEPSKTIVMQMEPYVYDSSKNWGTKTWGEWANPSTSKFLKVFQHVNHLNNVQWMIRSSLTIPLTITINKINKVSVICSNKNFDTGHVLRNKFIHSIDHKNILHIFGKENYFNYESYQGQLKNDDKSSGIFPYKYHFACENNIELNYATEKLWDAILGESLCFYYGCPNIDQYIDPEAFVKLDLNNFEESLNIINDAIQQDLWSKKIHIIKREKEKILNHLGFFPTLHKLIHG